jgi:diguanylate cyclase (GGDEF)-like protein/PAS domain S-box-containing protein
VLVAAIAVFAIGIIVAVVQMVRYGAMYRQLRGTIDVRLVLARTVGHASQAPSCTDLRADLSELGGMTDDDPAAHSRLPGLRASIDQLCAKDDALALREQLAAVDAGEQALLTMRREDLAAVRVWVVGAFVASMIGAIAIVLIAQLLHQRSLRALFESEERFRMLAATATDLLRIHDPSGRALWASPSSERWLGYTPAELLAMPPMIEFSHPDDLASMRATLAAIQKPGAVPSTLNYRLRTKAGVYRWFETHTVPVQDRAGKLVRFYTSARDITERMEAEKKLERIAVTDELTGLLNRRGFMMMAGQHHRVALRKQTGLAVVFADLDGLKVINDTQGHEIGDHAICEFAEMLRRTFRESDVVARLGGDEFAALVHDVDRAQLDAALDRVRAAVDHSAVGRPYQFSVSLGVALLDPAASRPLEELLAEADHDMYSHKRARRASGSPTS